LVGERGRVHTTSQPAMPFSRAARRQVSANGLRADPATVAAAVSDLARAGHVTAGLQRGEQMAAQEPEPPVTKTSIEPPAVEVLPDTCRPHFTSVTVCPALRGAM